MASVHLGNNCISQLQCINKRVFRSSLLSGRNVHWPRRMLPASESRWVCRRDKQTDRRTDGRHTLTLCFPLDEGSKI